MTGTAWLALDDRRAPLPPGWGPLTGHRYREEWTWRLLDRATRRYLGDLDGVEGGDLTLNVNADTRGTGSLTWSGPLVDQPVWRDVRVQPVYSATLLYGSTITWPMGLYMCSSPSVDVADRHAQTTLQLYDQTLVLRRARLGRTSGVAAGTNVVDHVRWVAATQAPSVQLALEDSPATLRSSMTWDADTPWLTIFNALLTAAGMVALWADPDGLLRSAPYVRPQDRPVVWAFDEGVTAVHEEDVVHTRDDFEVPNRVNAISRGDEDAPVMRATVLLDDLIPGHPLSYERTGQWVDRVERDVEAADLAVLRSRAERWMREGIEVIDDVTITHMPVPISLLDRVSLDSGGLVVPSGTVQTITIPCTPGEDLDWTTRIRKVVE